jgi:hypothetical protein
MYDPVEGPLDPAEALERWLIPRLQNAYAEIHNERKTRAAVPGLADAFVGAEDETTATEKLQRLLEIAHRAYPEHRFKGAIALKRPPSGFNCWLPEIEMIEEEQVGPD